MYCISTVIHYFLQGLHPRLITEGFELARNKALEVLEEVKIKKEIDRDTLIQVARTSLRTKVHQELADLLTGVCVITRADYHAKYDYQDITIRETPLDTVTFKHLISRCIMILSPSPNYSVF